MPIDIDKKILFIHIPKTGGTTIEKIIFNLSLKNTEENYKKLFGRKNNNDGSVIQYQHLTYNEIINNYDFNLDKFYKFTFVRNPYDRIVSEFFYQQQNKVPFLKNIEKMNFKDFLYAILNREWINNIKENEGFIKSNIVHILPQYKFIYVNDNVFSSNTNLKIFKFENFLKGVSQIFKDLNMEMIDKIPHHLKSIHNYYLEYYDDECKEIVNNLYLYDFLLFDYKL